MEELRKSIILKILITLVSGILMMVVTSFVMILCNFKIVSVNGIIGMVLLVTLPQLWSVLRNYKIPTMAISLGMIAVSLVLSLIYGWTVANSVAQYTEPMKMFETILAYILKVHGLAALVTVFIGYRTKK
ncbi:hypothetical protein [Solobacterium sp.]|uniref:hypothetical protein n=1 Tax=Solobacterium sp. TaxID=2060878 RepID=UPI001CB1F462|nr:hypothetical protein [Solobacterium sp.]MBF1092151.1 hypothetical protein [Solobacterium sp.]MBF1098951.1 hypothetical protein [Solobacterium sp.]MBF1105713.1 hypothetical protein [Solobacterium sp.]MBF1108900.1 hypothetical protein [Solobacterium sp.]MBF1113016.1 hypothetical protein [Solobacterium sp.]